MREGVYGTAWEVHGGGFYQVEKYLVAPKELPPDLVWYKWEAYLTWVTGFALLILQYYWHADVFLISKSVLPMLPIAGDLHLDRQPRRRLVHLRRLVQVADRQEHGLLALAVFVLIVAAAWFFTHVFSGRGALIHVGAFIGTIMAVNVFGIIIPNQRKIVASLMAGEPPDPALGAIGKQRSVHNNYLTLPVLLMMVSNHYPMLSSHPQTWLIVALIIVVGAVGAPFPQPPRRRRPVRQDRLDAAGRGRGAGRRDLADRAAGRSGDCRAARSATARCSTSSASTASCAIRRTRATRASTAPPKDVILNSPDDVRRHAAQIMAQAVNGDTMPLGNETGMTREERQKLGAFLLNR